MSPPAAQPCAPYVEQITGQIASFVVSGVLLSEERLPSNYVAAKHIGVGKDIMVDA
jgi:DNA-binding transcriptional regulator YhcF (GntR family)